jgi:phosphatidylserine decarboxylase
MSDQLFILLQKLAPKQALTQFAGWVAQGGFGEVATQHIIRRFIAHYQVNMDEALSPDPLTYKTFNDFFTRQLRPDARPIANSRWVCPVDGAISQLGRIEGQHIFQAKGHHYSTRALLGGDSSLAAQFDEGHFATIYLSPKDYHRIHMPIAGRLRRMIHIPGKLYSVNPATARNIPGLFAVNERVVTVFDTEHGPFVNVLVGATIVGSMATTWHGVVNPPRTGKIREWRYEDQEIMLDKGAEMGRFLLGSTVVMLWPKNTIAFNDSWKASRPVRLNEAMAGER